ncbi:hypothetical protein YC2023_016880 [Brassica napus]
MGDVDKTNQSYYGETKLHYLTVDGTHEGLVPLRKDGPVHDVQWVLLGVQSLQFLALQDVKIDNGLSGEMNTVHKLYLFMTAYVMIKIFNYDRKRYFKKMFERLYQAEWKPEFPDRFSEISELVKAVDSLKLEDGKSQGLSLLDKDQLRRKLLLPSPLYKNRLNIGLRSPHAKHAAAIQAKLLGGNPAGEMSKNALKNKKKKGAEAAASGANNA